MNEKEKVDAFMEISEEALDQNVELRAVCMDFLKVMKKYDIRLAALMPIVGRMITILRKQIVTDAILKEFD